MRQVEYYFSDHSYPFDDFMKSLAAAEGKDRFIDLAVLAGATHSTHHHHTTFCLILRAHDDTAP